MADFSRYGGVAEDWDRVIAAEPPGIPLENLSVDQLQQTTNQEREEKAAQAIQNMPGVSTEDTSCISADGEKVPIRVYRPAHFSGNRLPGYIWYHGGGFLFGTLGTEDAHCYRIVRELGIIVVNIEYRHTPRWKWPKQLQDCQSGFKWVFDNLDQLGIDASKVLIAGRSAGALLAARLAIVDSTLTGKSRLCGQILDIPTLCHSRAFPNELIAPGKTSWEENRNAPVLPVAKMELFENLVVVTDPTDVSYSVLLTPSEKLKTLPKTCIQVAGRDPLRDHGLLYAEKLSQAGVDTKVHVYPGVPHGFRRYGGLEASKKWDLDHFKTINDMLQLHLNF